LALRLRWRRARLELLAAELDGHDGVRAKVVIPGRVGRRAALGRHDHERVAIAREHDRVGALSAALRAFGGEEEDVATHERTLGHLAMRPEVLDQAAVPVVHPSPLTARAAGLFRALVLG